MIKLEDKNCFGRTKKVSEQLKFIVENNLSTKQTVAVVLESIAGHFALYNGLGVCCALAPKQDWA